MLVEVEICCIKSNAAYFSVPEMQRGVKSSGDKDTRSLFMNPHRSRWRDARTIYRDARIIYAIFCKVVLVFYPIFYKQGKRIQPLRRR